MKSCIHIFFLSFSAVAVWSEHQQTVLLAQLADRHESFHNRNIFCTLHFSLSLLVRFKQSVIDSFCSLKPTEWCFLCHGWKSDPQWVHTCFQCSFSWHFRSSYVFLFKRSDVSPNQTCYEISQVCTSCNFIWITPRLSVLGFSPRS